MIENVQTGQRNKSLRDVFKQLVFFETLGEVFFFFLRYVLLKWVLVIDKYLNHSVFTHCTRFINWKVSIH